jgi:hypothetical protein
MLVYPLNNYYKKGEIDYKTQSNLNYEVGVIEHIGCDLDASILGKVIYYHINMAEKINLKNIGTYHLVSESMKLLIRFDQDKNNY